MWTCNHEDLIKEVKLLAKLVAMLYKRQGELMADFTKLTAAVSQLNSDVRAHDAGVQAAVDNVATNVTGIDQFLTTGTSTTTGS